MKYNDNDDDDNGDNGDNDECNADLEETKEDDCHDDIDELDEANDAFQHVLDSQLFDAWNTFDPDDVSGGGSGSLDNSREDPL
jgi:hypothetical protein